MRRHCDLEAWRIFLNVVEAGSIAKASDESEMAPSNICRILNALEESLGGVILFERSSPIILTSAGHIALTQARILVSQHDAMLDCIFQIGILTLVGCELVALAPSSTMFFSNQQSQSKTNTLTL